MEIQKGKWLARIGGKKTTVPSTRSGPTARQGEAWSGQASTYYNIPLIKKAHWTWEIILYFFLGGIAGGSFLVSTIAHLFGSSKDALLVRVGRYLAFVSILASPILLIKDLGRPERFHHMLRILKFRSVMSLGTWGISVFGMCCGFTTIHQMANDHLLDWMPPFARFMRALPVRIIEAMGAVFGMFVASYTGVLLAATAVPVWARAKYVLGPLFLSSGLSTALSALSLILSFGRPREDTLKRLDRAEVVTMTAELGLIASLIPTLRSLGNPLFKGRIGQFFKGGTIGAGLLLPLFTKLGWRVSGRSPSRSITIGTSLLVLTGGLILRAVWILAGRISADTPEATHTYNALEWEERHR